MQATAEIDEYLAGRYLRSRTAEAVVWEFTRDIAYIHQYRLLRSKGFSEPLSESLRKAEELLDDVSHLVVARLGNHVVAGGRLTISSPRREVILPLEENGMRLRHLLPEYNLALRKYAQFSQISLQAGFDSDEMQVALLQHAQRKMLASRVEYLVANADAATLALYQRAGLASEQKNITVAEDAFSLLTPMNNTLRLLIAPIWESRETAAIHETETAENDAVIYA
jgi:hypothetical protein